MMLRRRWRRVVMIEVVAICLARGRFGVVLLVWWVVRIRWVVRVLFLVVEAWR